MSVDKFGNRQSLDDLAKLLIARDIDRSSCFGTHIHFALATLLRRDEDEPGILGEHTKNLAIHYLKTVSRDLENFQDSAGSLRNWANQFSNAGRPTSYVDQQVREITVLGHHLEWIAISRPDWRPQDDCIKKAVDALAETLPRLPPYTIRGFKSQLPVTHAARALLCLSGDGYRFNLDAF